MMKALQVFLLIQIGTAIRVRNREQKKTESSSFLKVLAIGQKEADEVHISFDEDSDGNGDKGGKPGGFTPLPGGFQYVNQCSGGCGVKSLDVADFMGKLLTDLPAEKAAALKQCQAKVSGKTAAAGVAGEVWVLLNAEKLTREQVAAHTGWNDPSKKVLIIGAPGADNVGPHVKNIYLPYASFEFVDAGKHTPMSLVNRSFAKDLLALKDDKHIYAYQHHNCKANREHDFDVMCESLVKNDLSCHALGQCHGTNGLAQIDNSNNEGGRSAVGSDGRILRTQKSIERFSKYKFVEAFENNVGVMDKSGDGYITEKILSPYLAGAVPIHAGGDGLDLAEVFNPKSLVQADINDLAKTAERIKYLVDHPAEYEKMVMEPSVTEESMKKYFTWHPATWPTYGTHLRDKIIDQILDLCHS